MKAHFIFSSLAIFLSLWTEYGFAQDPAQSLKRWVLTDDFGILSQSDLKKAAEWSIAPPVLERFSPVIFWQCYPSDEVKLECGKSSVEPKSTNIPTLKVQHAGHLIQVETKDVFPLGYCDEVFPKWRRLIYKREPVCIAAKYLDDDIPVTASEIKRRSIWEFFGIKSKRGSWYYFHGDGV